MGEWDRARRAYRALVDGADPVADTVAAGAVDLRPGGRDDVGTRLRIVSGPLDLVELRSVVESITGPGTWPDAPTPEGELRRATLPLDRPAPALALVGAMEGLIEDRLGMWRTWRTTLELIAAALADVPTLTLEAVIIPAEAP